LRFILHEDQQPADQLCTNDEVSDPQQYYWGTAQSRSFGIALKTAAGMIEN
jgi:hypothetical protein